MAEKVFDNQCHDWFQYAPIPMLALDQSGRIRWANRALETMVGLPGSQLLGHTRSSLPSPTHKVLFAEDTLVHLKGPGAPERWLRCAARDDENDPPLRLHCYTDATREVELEKDNRKLRETIDNLCLTDEQTGLPNRRAFKQQLEIHVSRSRRYNNSLSVVYVTIDIDQPDARDAVIIALGQHLRDRLRWADQIARWDERGMMIVLPETEEGEARAVAAKTLADDDPVQLPKAFVNLRPTVHYGVATWHRGDDTRTLLRRVIDETSGNRRASSA